MNQEIISHFRTLLNYYRQTGDKGRVFGYSKIIGSLNTVNFPITLGNVDKLKSIKGIGPKAIDKIKEYLKKGKIEAVEKRKNEVIPQTEKQRVISLFRTVHGIGEKYADHLYKSGFRTLDDLRDHEYLLTDNQNIGLKYHDDLVKRVPRDYITMLYIVIKVLLNRKYGEGSYKLEVAGSYRRKHKTSGDMDCLITSDKFNLKDVIDLLYPYIIKETLSMKKQKFMGIAGCKKYPSQNIRLDIQFVPKKEWGTSLLYFTGSKDHNVYMRGIAKKKGYILNEHGLFYNTPSKQRVLDNPSEKDIYKTLGIPYLDPENR